MGRGETEPRRPSALTLSGLLEVTGLVLCLATLTGFLGRLWWLLELTCHFRAQFVVALGVLTLVWLVKRTWRHAAVCGVCAAVNLALVLSLVWPTDAGVSSGGARLRLVAINVDTANERSDLVLNYLRAADADVVLLMEVNERWMRALEPLTITHSKVIAEPREDNFGIALFSRRPLTNGTVVEFGSAGVPSITANVSVGEQEVLLLGTHPLPPGTSEYARLRNEQLREIAAAVRDRREPVVLFGDLNVTPWSPYFRELLRGSRLRNTSQGRGLFASWPAKLPPARIPLDHCLVSASVQVVDKHLGPQVGGDHLPVLVEFQLAAGHSTAK